MLKLVVIGTIAVAVNAYTHQIISEVKAKTNLWTPTELGDNQFQGWSKAQLNALCGTIITPSNDLPTFVDEKTATAANFDSRTVWPGKIGAIRDQQQCGACWAFGASEAFADRYAINSGEVLVFSPEEMVSCDSSNFGCQGGYLNKANDYIVSHGVPVDSCTPYTAGSGSAPSCKSKCADGSSMKLYKAKHVSSAGSPTSIKNLIAAGGPVETGFTVYEDFFAYKSGIYHHVSGGQAGGHAVKIIGWGVEAGTNFWIVANSWGTSWGINGTFKIRQGECGIDQRVYGVTF
jgi:cathepsin B